MMMMNSPVNFESIAMVLIVSLNFVCFGIQETVLHLRSKYSVGVKVRSVYQPVKPTDALPVHSAHPIQTNNSQSAIYVIIMIVILFFCC